MKQELTLNKPLEDCEIGVEKEITVRVVPTENTEHFRGTVSEVVGYEEEDDEMPEPKPKRKSDKEMAPAMEDY